MRSEQNRADGRPGSGRENSTDNPRGGHKEVPVGWLNSTNRQNQFDFTRAGVTFPRGWGNHTGRNRLKENQLKLTKWSFRQSAKKKVRLALTLIRRRKVRWRMRRERWGSDYDDSSSSSSNNRNSTARPLPAVLIAKAQSLNTIKYQKL